MIGTTIDNRYKIIKLLGIGGMSSVYLSTNIRLDNNWAIKVVNKDNDSDNLHREVNLLKNLSHNSLPRVIDVFDDGSKIYIVEDYIDGIDLSLLQLRIGTFEPALVIAIGIELSKVLMYLHNLTPSPIIYKDLKPSNIMIDSQSNIKLIDFGISKQLMDGEGTMRMGTKGFVAPEVLAGRSSDIQSDIFSLCATLYYLLFNNHNYNIKPYTVSEGLNEILQRGLSSDSRQRYQKIEDVLASLESLINIPSNEVIKTILDSYKYTNNDNESYTTHVL